MKINKLMYKDDVVGINGLPLKQGIVIKRYIIFEWALLTSIKLIRQKAYGWNYVWWIRHNLTILVKHNLKMFVKHNLTMFVKHNLTTFAKHNLTMFVKHNLTTFVKHNLTIIVNNFCQQDHWSLAVWKQFLG